MYNILYIVDKYYKKKILQVTAIEDFNILLLVPKTCSIIVVNPLKLHIIIINLSTNCSLMI